MAKHGARKERSLAGRIIGQILLWFFVLIVIAAIAGGIWFYNKYGRELIALRTEAQITALNSTRDDFTDSQTSIVYYSDGSVMQILKGTKNVYYLPYNSIPQNAVNAVLAVEDRKFFRHKGYDVYAIARAAKAFIENEGAIKQGGSTITQQLARATYLTNEKTITRKVKEIFLAAALERKYSKYDILEFYLNNIYFANGYYGLQAAAKGYFNITASDLTLSQTAFLCGIPNSPSACDPLRHYDNAMERRDKVLKQMYETGFIDYDAYKDALREKITLVSTVTEKNNYEETYAYRCAVQAIMQAEGFTVRYYFDNDEDKALYDELYDAEYSRAWRNLYTKGYRIYTSINPTKQEQLQQAIDEELAEFTDVNESGVYKLQAAAACIDNDTGLVVAIVGGRLQESAGYTLNRAFQSPRQPGSSIKPLIIYTPAFERGYYPDTTVVDEKFEGGPRNSGGVYSGEIDVRYAVSVSKNTVAWKLFTEIGIGTGLEYLKKMNFAHIVDTDYYPAASLGGMTYGTTAVEMTSGYAAIENDGVFRSPTCIVRITDTMGNPIVENTSGMSARVTKRIYDRNAARMMTDVLTTVMESGTGRKVRLDRQICAGKTGTTNDQKDGWFVGFTRYYTTGVWVGCDMPKAMEELKGNTYPAYIWHHYMQQIHEGLEEKPFEPYTDNRPPKPEEPDDDGEEADSEDTDPENAMNPENPGGQDETGDAGAGPDTDIDGVYPYGWIDTDTDGKPDSYPFGWTDNDGDMIPDGYPPGLSDSDGDGVPDIYEVEEPLWVRPGDGYVWVDPRDGSVFEVELRDEVNLPEELDSGDEVAINDWYTQTEDEVVWVDPREVQ